MSIKSSDKYCTLADDSPFISTLLKKYLVSFIVYNFTRCPSGFYEHVVYMVQYSYSRDLHRILLQAGTVIYLRPYRIVLFHMAQITNSSFQVFSKKGDFTLLCSAIEFLASRLFCRLCISLKLSSTLSFE